MRRILAILLLLAGIAAADSLSASTTLMGASNDVWVADMLYHGPYPDTYPALIMPGQEGIWIDVAMKNYNSAEYQNITGTLEVAGPFEGLITTSTIARAKPQETVHAFYQLSVDEDAKPGEYKLRHKLKYSYLVTDDKGTISSVSVDAIRSISVVVYNSERIEIKSINIEPSHILPGEEGNMNVVIENTGSVTVNDVLVGYSIITDPTVVNVLPIGYSTARIATIRPGESTTKAFRIKALETATVKGYKVVVGAAYTSGTETVNTTQEAAIDVRGEPKIRLAGVQTDKDTIFANQPFSLSVQLENTGTGDAKSVKTELQDGTIDGVLTSYVGTVEASDTGSAIFDIRDSAPGRRKITALVTYEDKYGEKYTERMDAEYYVTAVSADYTTPAIAIIAIAGVGFWYWRSQQKKKRIEQLVK